MMSKKITSSTTTVKPNGLPVILTNITAPLLMREMNTAERNNGISKSVPDQTYSVSKLAERAARGLDLGTGGGLTPMYLGEEEHVVFERLEPTEQAEFVKQQRRLYAAATERMENEKRAQKDAAFKKRFQRLVKSEAARLANKTKEATHEKPKE